MSKFKKVHKLLLLGSSLLISAAVVTAIAASCNNQSKGGGSTQPGTGTGTGTGTKKVKKSNLTTEQKQAEWKDKALSYAATQKSVNPDYVNIITQKPNVALDRTSGSLEQSDSAYSFGIAPHLSHFKWQGSGSTDSASGKNVVVPHYLNKYYDSSMTEGWVGRINEQGIQTIVEKKIGVLFTTESNVEARYKKLAEDKTIGAVVAQSRSSGLPSKYPWAHKPAFMFDDKANKYLHETDDSHAGNPNYLVSPNYGLIYTGQMLDKVYDASKFEPVNKATIAGQTGFTSFEAYSKKAAETAIAKTREWTRNNQQWKDKSVVVMMPNPQAGSGIIFTNDIKNETNKYNLGNVFYVQPVYHPWVYGSIDHEFVPGLGAKFPTPKKDLDTMSKYVDDYGWIGGKTLVEPSTKDTSSKQVAPNLANAFENTTDKVIYTYNQYMIEGFDGTEATEDKVKAFEEALTKYIDGLSDTEWKQFNPTKILKEKPKVGKNFFIVRKDDWYDGSYGFLGQKVVVDYLDNWVKEKNGKGNVDLGLPKLGTDKPQHLEPKHLKR